MYTHDSISIIFAINLTWLDCIEKQNKLDFIGIIARCQVACDKQQFNNPSSHLGIFKVLYEGRFIV